ncbi:MAG TPA: hypothetical protein VFK57_02905 [Vicinamibacterales bacterium]|nr:hypothetical protein [Vicinamibacterales bacterium]
MSLRVGFDMDGVLADFRTAFRQTAERCLRKRVGEDADDDQSRAPLTADDIRRVWDHIGRTPNWWMDVPAYEPAQIARLYGLMRSTGWEIFFMTKRPPSAGDSVQFQTQWWIERFGYYLPAVLTVPGSRGEVANGLRLDLIVDDQIINCAEVIGAGPTKALLMLREPDPAARTLALNRGIGVVSTLSEAITILEQLHDVVPKRRGRLFRLSDWFSAAEEQHEPLPHNPREVRPIPERSDP